MVGLILTSGSYGPTFRQAIDDMQLRMTQPALAAYLEVHFPQAGANGFGVRIEALQPRQLTVSLASEDRHLRPGGTVSGPTLFTLADVASYLCILAHLGPLPQVVTTNMAINFLSRPAPGRLVARTDLLKLGRRLAVVETSLFTPGDADGEPCAHAVGTYAIPPNTKAENMTVSEYRTS